MVSLYRTLIKTGEGLFIRASGSDRVVESAGYWMDVSQVSCVLVALLIPFSQGFDEQPFKLKPVDQLPIPDVIIPEGEVGLRSHLRLTSQTSNNTLSVHSCPAFNNQSVP